MTPRVITTLRAVGGAAVLAVLVWQLGAGPFLRGLRAVDAGAVLAAVGITAGATACAAWRWRVVSRRLGAALGMREAIAAYYRSQLVNLTVPGGVLGDVDRAVGHGRRTGDVGVAARAVVWERVAGQAVQAVVTVAVLALFPSPVRGAIPVAALAGLALAAAIVTAAVRCGRRRRAASPTRWRHLLAVARGDLRRTLLGPNWPALAIASLLAVAGHIAIFLIAARLAVPAAPVVDLLPLVVLALAAGAVPLHLVGWGPREGVAAWLFAAAGPGAAAGVEAATVYGVLALASCLPGFLVLLAGWCRRRRARGRPARAAGTRAAAIRGVAIRGAAVSAVGQAGVHG